MMIKKSYLFICNNFMGTHEQILSVINKMPSVIYWRYEMSNVFYLTSHKNAFELSNEFIKVSGFETTNTNRGKFIFTEYNGNAQGWLTEASWYLLNTKELKKE